MNILKTVYGMLPLKAKRRLNKKLVSVGLKSAPKARGKVRKPRKPVVTQTAPASVTSDSSTPATSA